MSGLGGAVSGDLVRVELGDLDVMEQQPTSQEFPDQLLGVQLERQGIWAIFLALEDVSRRAGSADRQRRRPTLVDDPVDNGLGSFHCGRLAGRKIRRVDWTHVGIVTAERIDPRRHSFRCIGETMSPVPSSSRPLRRR
jgi:hypothetical protein